MISVITPVYNGLRFIEGCINNVIEQKCSDVEHIIIDGGSTDGSAEIIRKYAETHPHIKWISEKDKGQSDAMNKGIAMARGSILGILNVDDYYEPNVLCRIMELFKSLPNPAFLVGNCSIWDDHGNLINVCAPAKISLTNILLGRYWEAYPMNPSAYFYHTSLHDVVGLYKTDEHFAMDMDFILRAVQSATVVYRNEMWGNYRYLEGTKSHNDKTSGTDSERVAAIFRECALRLPVTQRYTIYALQCVRKCYLSVKSLVKLALGM